LIQQYQNEIAELKALLREKEGGGYDLKTSKGDVSGIKRSKRVSDGTLRRSRRTTRWRRGSTS